MSWKQYRDAQNRDTIDLRDETLELKKMQPCPDSSVSEKKRLELADKHLRTSGVSPPVLESCVFGVQISSESSARQVKTLEVFISSDSHSQNSAKPVSQNMMEAYYKDTSPFSQQEALYYLLWARSEEIKSGLPLNKVPFFQKS